MHAGRQLQAIHSPHRTAIQQCTYTANHAAPQSSGSAQPPTVMHPSRPTTPAALPHLLDCGHRGDLVLGQAEQAARGEEVQGGAEGEQPSEGHGQKSERYKRDAGPRVDTQLGTLDPGLVGQQLGDQTRHLRGRGRETLKLQSSAGSLSAS